MQLVFRKLPTDTDIIKRLVSDLKKPVAYTSITMNLLRKYSLR